ncbi:MAG TPA: T9SS type A sorting domain-containing protein [Bacteroidales bacterium]|nr:T9SS type A sorting domain-containing protein [Bacteroidales bacterium]
MRRILLVLIILAYTFVLHAQKDTSTVAINNPRNSYYSSANVNVSIYPVPVKYNSFTIKTDKDVTLVRITNIIGQDIYRAKYNEPLQLIKITLDNPRRGMYLVTILFSDNTRTVKKIMVEESE